MTMVDAVMTVEIVPAVECASVVAVAVIATAAVRVAAVAIAAMPEVEAAIAAMPAAQPAAPDFGSRSNSDRSSIPGLLFAVSTIQALCQAYY